MFQIMKMRITENKAERKFIIEKHFSMKFFPDFPDTHSKFPDNSLFFSKKGSIFRLPDNSLIALISRLAVNPEHDKQLPKIFEARIKFQGRY